MDNSVKWHPVNNKVLDTLHFDGKESNRKQTIDTGSVIFCE